MGIRIHKELGWGLTGLEYDDTGRLTDPRINSAALREPPGGFHLAYRHHLARLHADLPDEFGEPLDVTLEMSALDDLAQDGKRLWWPIVHDADGGRPDVLLVRPPALPRWSRYDDPLDFAEEHALHRPPEPRVVPLRTAPFPYSGAYMDDRDGRTVSTTAWRALERLLDEPAEENETPDRAEAAQRLATLLGYDDAEQARRHTVPQVPGDIRRVCAWANLFTSGDMWRQLRPMLYAYWS